MAFHGTAPLTMAGQKTLHAPKGCKPRHSNGWAGTPGSCCPLCNPRAGQDSRSSGSRGHSLAGRPRKRAGRRNPRKHCEIKDGTCDLRAAMNRRLDGIREIGILIAYDPKIDQVNLSGKRLACNDVIERSESCGGQSPEGWLREARLIDR